MAMDKRVDEYISRQETFGEPLAVLCELLRASGLEETVKWGAPCYTLGGKNVVGIAAFKQHCALWFHQGALLPDPDNVLVNAQAGTTRALRQWRFEPGVKIPKARVRRYIQQAVANQQAGREIKPDRQKKLGLCTELVTALKADADFEAAFGQLTAGRQREYATHVGDAKREATRLSRIEKIRPMVIQGIGLNDKYR